MRFRIFLACLALGAAAVAPARAADHRDGPAVRVDPASDINDVFAWTSADASHIHLAMTVFPFAGSGARFSDQVQYVFHTTSQAAFGAGNAQVVDVICEFDAVQTLQCWVGSDAYISGDAATTSGLVGDDGRVRVYAGLRNDPFFFNLNGFNATTALVVGAAGGLTFDAAGCPALDAATSNLLVQQLATEPNGAPATDEFLAANTLILVLSIDKDLLTSAGDIVGVWAGTYAKN